MVKYSKKLIIPSIFVILTFMLLISMITLVYASNEVKTTGTSPMLYALDTTSNFFTQVDSKEQMTIVDNREFMITKEGGYKLVEENEYLQLYFKEKTVGIAIYDKVNGYTWYSQYNNEDEYNFSALVNAKNESGITIEYYYSDSKGKINTTELCYTQRKDGKQTGSSTYKKIDKGFALDVNFKQYGISFRVEVTIDNSSLKVNVPYDSIKEVKVGTLNVSEYKLKSITLFPYFGSQNYKINGYAFIPDGSGALIRYNNTSSSTAFIKKIYGNDDSFQEVNLQSHIKETGSVSLPIYGISHGYNQAAFLCEIESGSASSEIHSYPYMYNNLPINTSFFKYIARDTFKVDLSSSTMTLMNDVVYPSDYRIKYSFLENKDANYVGMANCYRNSLDLRNNKTNSDIPLHLEILGLDYKKGLFGNNYVVMTTFDECLEIIKDLENNNVNNLELTYLGWNKGGYFNDGAINAKVATKLGGKKGLSRLEQYLDSKNYLIDFTINPLISDTYGFNNKTIKKVNLSSYEVTMKSSLEQEGYFTSPSELANIILSKNKKYKSLGITGLNIDNLNKTFSYRYDSKVYYREEMIENVKESISKLIDYRISTSLPHHYLYRYLDNYYQMNYESSKYIYETDSIPFISILLSGYVDLFMPNINYLSDYNYGLLRMIEYNIYPSFIITNKEAYKLRYTNFEYLNSTEYSLWKDLIISMYKKSNDALRYVRGAKIINHEVLSNGVIKTSYDNGYSIIVNYNENAYNGIEPYSYCVITGGDE